MIIITEIGRCFGGGLKGGALAKHFSRAYKPNAQRILEALERGEDPLETIPMGDDVKGGKGQNSVFSTSSRFPYVEHIFGSDIDILLQRCQSASALMQPLEA